MLHSFQLLILESRHRDLFSWFHRVLMVLSFYHHLFHCISVRLGGLYSEQLLWFASLCADLNVPIHTAEKWHCNGHYQEWYVWLSNRHCASRGDTVTIQDTKSILELPPLHMIFSSLMFLLEFRGRGRWRESSASTSRVASAVYPAVGPASSIYECRGRSGWGWGRNCW